MRNLQNWFITHRRELPWRRDPTPYAVWVSEVMLQQTQVAVVIPYFQSWMERFPTVEDLAKAPLSDVIKCWEGLGYYSRARNLHEGARYLLKHHSGKIPSNQEKLEKVKGIGKYTMGAILSFAFHQRVAAVDGNVMRVLSRFFAIDDPIDRSTGKKKIQNLAQTLLPETEPWVIAEALIELGATVCKKTPNCSACPIRQKCKAHHLGIQRELPKKGARPKTIDLQRQVALVLGQNSLLVRKTPQGEVMAGLHEFPYFETEEKIDHLIEKRWGLTVERMKQLPHFNHTFTRYKATLKPTFFLTHSCPFIEGLMWIPIPKLDRLAFSAGHKKILQYWLCQNV